MSSPRFSSGTLLLMLTVWAAAASPSGAQSDQRPQRIISLVPAVTEMLFAIGAGERVVAVSSFDRFPPEIDKLPRVGALLDPDVERILSLKTDLVVVYQTQADLQAKLARAGIPMFLYEHAGLADVTSTLRQVGIRVGTAQRAAQLAEAIEQRIAAVRNRTRDVARPRTLIIIGRDPLALRGIFASGGIGFIHDMVSAAGGDNVFGDVQRQAVQATTELLIARRPEVILELRAEPVGRAMLNRELETWATLSSIPAVRDRRIRVIGDPRTVIPGPRVADAVELLADVLHPSR